MASFAGRLLIATPQLRGSTFTRAVILLLDHDGDGALGVVLNRPSELPLQAVLPSWADVVTGPPVLFAGGPVARDSALAVGVSFDAVPAEGFRQLTGTFGLVDLDADADAIGARLVGVRVFSGYAGWGDGQLEGEIEEGSWYVVSAMPADVLTAAPQGLWRSVLRRQPGELSYLATYADDPTMN